MDSIDHILNCMGNMVSLCERVYNCTATQTPGMKYSAGGALLANACVLDACSMRDQRSVVACIEHARVD